MLEKKWILKVSYFHQKENLDKYLKNSEIQSIVEDFYNVYYHSIVTKYPFKTQFTMDEENFCV